MLTDRIEHTHTPLHWVGDILHMSEHEKLLLHTHLRVSVCLII